MLPIALGVALMAIGLYAGRWSGCQSAPQPRARDPAWDALYRAGTALVGLRQAGMTYPEFKTAITELQTACVRADLAPLDAPEGEILKRFRTANETYLDAATLWRARTASDSYQVEAWSGELQRLVSKYRIFTWAGKETWTDKSIAIFDGDEAREKVLRLGDSQLADALRAWAEESRGGQ